MGRIVNMQMIIETVKMDGGTKEITKTRRKDDNLKEENLESLGPNLGV